MAPVSLERFVKQLAQLKQEMDEGKLQSSEYDQRLARAIRELRERDGAGVQVMGSPSLATQLVEHDLVDEYRLMVEPILLGGGKRLFPSDGRARPLELVSVTTAGTGVLICAYRPVRG